MYGRLLFIMLIASVGCLGQAAAQETPSNGPELSSYHDYFEAAQMGMEGIGAYMRVLESAHVNNVPGQISRGELNAALANIRYTLDRFPNHPRSLQQLSIVAQITKNTALGVSYFEKAVSEFPNYAITHAQFGLYLVSIGNMDGGLEQLNQSISIDPKLPAGYAGLAHAYAKKGDLRRAKEAAQKARELGFTGKLPDGL